jgi:AraC-like DNA-binding protein
MLASPIGRYLAGSFYLHWVYSPSLIGTVYFGRPEESAFPALEPLFALPGHAALAAAYDVLVDCAALESLPPTAFEFLSRYLAAVQAVASRMRRVAIVRPPGHAGIVLAGVFYELVRGTFEAALFADRAEASRWLAHPDAPAAIVELDRLMDEIRQRPPQLRQLLHYLEKALRRPTLVNAAREMGVSPRSLQRLLSSAGTNFRRQVAHARIRAAEALLLDGSVKLEAVAREVGYSSLSHFTVAFRRATGEAPGDFRRRRQPAS